jgi:hypothetical protein
MVDRVTIAYGMLCQRISDDVHVQTIIEKYDRNSVEDLESLIQLGIEMS